VVGYENAPARSSIAKLLGASGNLDLFSSRVSPCEIGLQKACCIIPLAFVTAEGGDQLLQEQNRCSVREEVHEANRVS